jgi:uncharacterized membrane protein YhhN
MDALVALPLDVVISIVIMAVNMAMIVTMRVGIGVGVHVVVVMMMLAGIERLPGPQIDEGGVSSIRAAAILAHGVGPPDLLRRRCH